MSLTTLPHPSPSDLVALPPPVEPGTVWYDSTFQRHVTVDRVRPLDVPGWMEVVDFTQSRRSDACLVSGDEPFRDSLLLRDWHRYMIPAPPSPILCAWCDAPATDAVFIGATDEIGQDIDTMTPTPACARCTASYHRHPSTADDTPPWGTDRPRHLAAVPDIDIDQAVTASIGDTL